MTILNEILEYKKQEVLKQKQACNFSELLNSLKKIEPPKSFYNVLNEYKQKGKPALIAEVKKASPSKGVLREDFNPEQIATIYEKAGAAAISVLTDEKFFQGSIKYLEQIKKITTLPLLRKDFIVDEFQIYQTRAMGADIILLIAAALDKIQLTDYFNLSQELGLDVLLEVHNRKELDTALEAGAKIIGINNRSLKTFEVNLQTTIDLIQGQSLKDIFIISESGIKNSSDVKLLTKYGIAGILVGEAFIKENNIEQAVINLLK